MGSKAAIVGQYEVGCQEVQEKSEDGWEEECLYRKIVNISQRRMTKAFPPSISWNFLHSC